MCSLLDSSIVCAEALVKKYPNEKALKFSLASNTKTRDNILNEILTYQTKERGGL